MDTTDIFYGALKVILAEVVDGPKSSEAYLLNPGDPGILRQLDEVDEKAASHRPMKGLTTIASHTAHVLYGFTLSNRWADGEENPWLNADWSTAWKRTEVTREEWQALKTDLSKAVKKWQSALAEREAWSPIEARGALGIAAHLAYHLGAMRQILAAMDQNSAPK